MPLARRLVPSHGACNRAQDHCHGAARATATSSTRWALSSARCCHGPVDLDQYLLSGICATCKRAANREPDMGERSEPKRVCRRSALALFGYAAAFGLVASPAILMVSHAGAQTQPPRPPRRPLRRRSLVRNGVRNDARGAQNDVRNDARGAQSDARSGAQGAKSDVTTRDGTAEQKK